MKKFQEMVDVGTHKFGTFAAVRPNKETRKKMKDFSEAIKLGNPLDDDQYHVTIAFSKAPIPNARDDQPSFPITAKFKEWKVFPTILGTTGKCLVAAVESDELQEHHKMLIDKYKASYDYPEYIPHMTLTYSFDGEIPKEKPDFDFIFDSYIFKGIEPKYIGKEKK